MGAGTLLSAITHARSLDSRQLKPIECLHYRISGSPCGTHEPHA